MSAKRKELEEWFYPEAKKLSRFLSYNKKETEWKGRIPILVENAWEHQQKRIDELEYRLREHSRNL